MGIKISKSAGLRGQLLVPADKSISHRAVMLGAMAKGKSLIHNVLLSEDVKATIQAFQNLGAQILRQKADLVIEGRDLAFQAPQEVLDMGNSGTTTRLLMGILAGQRFPVRLSGDSSLSKRPMARVIDPLTLMGAKFYNLNGEKTLPLTMQGKDLSAIDYKIPVASAQVKSTLIFAALQAKGQTHLVEKEMTRNHTEKMLPLFGGEISVVGKEIFIAGGQRLSGNEFTVPGDISSAAFWLVAALIIPQSDLVLKNVGINETRTGILEVIQAMGGRYELLNINEISETTDIHVLYTEKLQAIKVSAELIPRLVDELPLLALLATQAEGQTEVSGAIDLRNKESDRIRRVTEVLQAMGANIEEKADGWLITGKTSLHGAVIDESFDHRIQMLAVIAGLIADKKSVELLNSQQIATSYPDFFADLEKICH